MKKTFIRKLNNEYFLAAGTAVVLILASGLALIVLVAAIKFSAEPITQDQAPREIITVEPMPRINPSATPRQREQRQQRQRQRQNQANQQRFKSSQTSLAIAKKRTNQRENSILVTPLNVGTE